MLFVELARTSQEIAKTRSRLTKVEHLAALLARLEANEIEPAVALLSGELRQGRIGLGGALLRRIFHVAEPAAASVTILEVDATLSRFAEAQGRGSAAQREALLGALFARMTLIEREFLSGVAAGGLRQGALEAIVLDAVAKATQLPLSSLRRALLFAGSAERVAFAALSGGAAALGEFSLQLFRPLRPMLADSAASVSDAIAAMPQAAIEYKLDGARIQVHRAGSEVRVFSRQALDVTARVPELVNAALSLPIQEFVLDGEAIAFDPSGRPLPFQSTMQRFGRQKNDSALNASLPLSQVYFDCLYLAGELLLDRPNSERFAALTELAPSDLLMPRLVTESASEAEQFVAGALSAGHEGVMFKDPNSVYDAGRRGSSWLKVKPVHTLDLVVLAVEWGSGRRSGLLSNIHLGARDPRTGEFVMLGKTFKGMTDEMLAWQTERFQQLASERQGHIVWLRHELVVEIAFDGVQASTQYPGGLSLRFARVRRYRPDKRPEDADTIDRVRQIFEQSRGQHGEAARSSAEHEDLVDEPLRE